MTTARIDSALVGAWQAVITFTEGPRQGESESLDMTFLGDGVIYTTNVRAGNGELPPAIGEWTADGDRFSYRLNAVLNDPSGRPAMVVYAHAQGKLAADGLTLRARGGSEIYGRSGERVATTSAELCARRADAS